MQKFNQDQVSKFSLGNEISFEEAAKKVCCTQIIVSINICTLENEFINFLYIKNWEIYKMFINCGFILG